jgi:hypothetical protein
VKRSSRTRLGPVPKLVTVALPVTATFRVGAAPR